MPRTWLTAAAVGRTIDAPAESLYRLITDVTATGDRSEECIRAEWLDDASREAVVGARFRGHNRSRLVRWSRVCEVIEADPARAFAFRTVPERFDPSRRDSTTWRYELVPDGGRTVVRHSYQITRPPSRLFKAVYGIVFPHHRDMRPAMQHTLDALARQAEADQPAEPPGAVRSG
jgi:uncharacterized protein YndB with AHSA1/START domain